MSASPIRCLIVDDEKPARVELRQLLSEYEGVFVEGEAATLDDAFEVLGSRPIDVIFLDVQLRGETGFDLVRRAGHVLPRLIFVTAHDRYAAEAFRLPAVDYLLKPINPTHLDQALRRLAQRPPNGRCSVVHPAALLSLGLSFREAEVLYWITHGKSNPQIATILHNSPETVKKQVQGILGRLNVKSRVSAALIAADILGIRGNEGGSPTS
jgi:DNA-binding NarL/FixJ family response regulator